MELLGVFILGSLVSIYFITLPFIVADKASKGLLGDLSSNPMDYTE